MIRRCEILVLPDRHPAVQRLAALERELGLTLDHPITQVLTSGGWTILLAADGAFLPANTEATILVEGAWPDAPGLRLLADPERWSLQSDALGVRPIHWTPGDGTGAIVSTRPDLLAALVRAGADAEGLAQLLLVGFTLGDRTTFAGVRRLRPAHALAGDRGGRLRLVATAPEPAAVDGADWVERAAESIDQARVHGAALELSGGVDSRLVLAIARHHGVMPEIAFTLGAEDEEDVTIAQALCERCRLDHVALAPRADHPALVEDARCFAARAGFQLPVCTHAWLPRALRALAPFRGAQVGGGGGECATGFYYAPLDPLLRSSAGRRGWVTHRLFRPGVDLEAILEPGCARRLRQAVIDEAVARLESLPGSWRRHTDGIYRTERVPNAGGPVLAACAAWYRPVQPLLHRPHLAWADARTPAERRGRSAQLRLLHALAPDLAELPFSHGRMLARSTPRRIAHRLAALRRSAARTRRRLDGSADCPELGAVAAARILVHRGEPRGDLVGLLDRIDLPVRADAVVTLMESAVPCPHLTGVLLAASWGLEAATGIRARLERGGNGEEVRRAA